MDLTIYDVIQGPVVTDKAYKLNQSLKKLVLQIHPKANKSQIKEALHRLFDVKIATIGIVVRKAKRKRIGKREVYDTQKKIAVVTLAEGYSLDLFDQAGATKVLNEKNIKLEKSKSSAEK